jgi:hypothetical protein
MMQSIFWSTRKVVRESTTNRSHFRRVLPYNPVLVTSNSMQRRESINMKYYMQSILVNYSKGMWKYTVSGSVQPTSRSHFRSLAISIYDAKKRTYQYKILCHPSWSSRKVRESILYRVRSDRQVAVIFEV